MKDSNSHAYLTVRHFAFGEGNGTPLQHSCLENPRDGGAWWAAVSGVAQSRTRLSDLAAAAAATFTVTYLPLKTVYLYGSSINIILNGEKLKTFYIRSRARKGHLATLGSLLKRVSRLKHSVWQDTTSHSYEIKRCV